jgi:hypothetical protein
VIHIHPDMHPAALVAIAIVVAAMLVIYVLEEMRK